MISTQITNADVFIAETSNRKGVMRNIFFYVFWKNGFFWQEIFQTKKFMSFFPTTFLRKLQFSAEKFKNVFEQVLSFLGCKSQ